MFADDLLGPIPFQTLDSRIPVQDISLRIEHENRVVLHLFHLYVKQILLFPKQHLELLAQRHVADQSHNENAVYGFDKAQTDFHRELAAVPAAPGKVQELAHRPDPGLLEKMCLMLVMDFTGAFVDENGMGLAYELLFRIPEHLLGAGINKQNDPGVVDDDHTFGERLQQSAYRDIALENSGRKRYLLLNF